MTCSSFTLLDTPATALAGAALAVHRNKITKHQYGDALQQAPDRAPRRVFTLMDSH
jgi:hypothetical protein